MAETRRCCICGREFEPYLGRDSQKTCGDPKCKAIRKSQTMESYAEEHRDVIREQKRDHMRRVRGSKKTTIKEIIPKPLPYDGNPADYGRQQVEKTLASLPKIKTEL